MERKNFIKRLFCKHDYEYLSGAEVYASTNAALLKMPSYEERFYRCTKCGEIYKERR